MKKLLFIYNPNAGKGLIKPKLSDVLDIFVKAGYEVTVYPTQKYRDGYHKVRHFKEEYDLVVCSGGDGTLDEVVTGMMKRKEQIPIGYIPTFCVYRSIRAFYRCFISDKAGSEKCSRTSCICAGRNEAPL